MPLISRHGPAATAFTVAVVAWLVFELVMRARQRWQAGRPASADPTFEILIGCLVAAVIAAEILGRDGRLPWPGGLAWPAVAGIALIIAGMGLRAWSIATLGRFFQYLITIQPSHQVVASEPTGTSATPPTPRSRSSSPASPWPVATCRAWQLPRPWAGSPWQCGSAPKNGS